MFHLNNPRALSLVTAFMYFSSCLVYSNISQNGQRMYRWQQPDTLLHGHERPDCAGTADICSYPQRRIPQCNTSSTELAIPTQTCIVTSSNLNINKSTNVYMYMWSNVNSSRDLSSTTGISPLLSMRCKNKYANVMGHQNAGNRKLTPIAPYYHTNHSQLWRWKISNTLGSASSRHCAPHPATANRQLYMSDSQPWPSQQYTEMPSHIVACHPLTHFARTIENVNTTIYTVNIHHRYFVAQESSGNDNHDYELVYPVTSARQSYPEGSQKSAPASEDEVRRSRRSLLRLKNETDYLIQAFGKTFHFDWIEPSQLLSVWNILSPGFTVQHVGKQTTWLDTETTRRDVSWLDNCLRVGTVNGDVDSKAVIDLCWNTLHNIHKPTRLSSSTVDYPAATVKQLGLMGAFHLPDADYLLQPYADVSSSALLNESSLNFPPHILYRTRYSNSSEPSNSSTPMVRNVGMNRTSYGRVKRDTDMTEFTSTAWEYHVELLVVADYSMRQFHGKELNEYILTLMSIVAMIYRDASIGNSISIIVGRLIVLENENDGPRITWSAQETLDSFCKWQSTYNVQEDSHPFHHDAAILLTRQDLCRIKNKCDTLGLAEIGTMCDRQKSCAIVEDSGLSSAFTIAHELGHLFNIPHDDDRVCRSFMPGVFSSYTSVMAPRLDHNSNPWTWSACSAKKLMDFLESGEASCLLDEPSSANNIPTRLELVQGRDPYQMERMAVNSFLFPGEMFDVTKQCQLVFGEGASVCPFMPVCKRLWCTTSLGNQTGCRTQHLPWADGTSCGWNMWCKRGECVKKDTTRLDPVDGGWGPWSRWGHCSRTCGGGIKESVRECSNPKPLNGGKYCSGQRIRYKSCNLKDCDQKGVDFREEQCAAFNGKTMGYQGVEPSVVWTAKVYGQTSRQKCKLYCRVEGTSKFFLLKEKVIDGTSCGADSSDICVNGVCKKAGCDGKLASQMKRDTCGVCGGDNSTCRTVTGTYNDRNYGYNFIVEIPEGASNIDVRQHAYENRKDDHNYLALVNSEGSYLFNGDFIVSVFHREYPVKNAVIDYTGSDTEIERINCSRKIGEKVLLYVLTVGELRPPDVYYSYMVSVGDEYRWDPEGAWNSCSKECKGLQYRNLLCVRKSDRHSVTKGNCAGQPPPAEHSRSCNDHCSLRWDIVQDPDAQCNAPCNEQGTIRRQVRCLRETFDDNPRQGETQLWYQDTLSSADQRNQAPRIQEVDIDKCNELSEPKPSEEVSCTGSCRLVAWKYTSWSECSRPCGGGIQSRSSVCVDLSTGHSVPPYNCSFHHAPEPNQKPCNPQPCAADWTVGPWSVCSTTCGPGIMRRAVKCLLRMEGTEADDALCDPVKKPAPAIRCPDVPCPPPPISGPPPMPRRPVIVYDSTPAYDRSVEWVTGSWTPCSKSCGRGERYRSVGCRSRDGKYLTHIACATLPKPHEKEHCLVSECGSWQFGEWGQCTATCNDGLGGAMQRRYVACVVNHRPVKDEDECDRNFRPPSTQLCPDLPTCEVRTLIRMKDTGDRGVDDPLVQVKYEQYYQPETTPRPPTTPQRTSYRRTSSYISTNSNSRKGVWITGGWGKCSKPCGGGMRLRLVACQMPDSQYRSTSEGPLCDESNRPTNTSRCNEQPCPEWKYGQWSPCNKSCGGGFQRRMVQCVDSRGSTMASYHCSRSQRPPGVLRCNKTPCSSTASDYWNTVAAASQIQAVQEMGPAAAIPPTPSPAQGIWHADTWSPCSVTCGKGTRKRKVTCVDPRRTESEIDETFCSFNEKPLPTDECRLEVCPKWRVSKWSECSTDCGNGFRTREILCARGGLSQHYQASMTKVDERLCQGQLKPKGKRVCEVYQCGDLYRWSVSRWSACSASCDSGKQFRQVQCVYSVNNTLVDASYCRLSGGRLKTPTSVRVCKTAKACAFRWIAGDWSKCSRTCGSGVRWRRVNCHKVEEATGATIWWPVESPYRCDTRNRPKERQICSFGECSDHFIWQIDNWTECSKSCGTGISKRNLYCLHQKSQQHLRHSFCKASLRPESTKSCNPEPCSRLNEVLNRT